MTTTAPLTEHSVWDEHLSARQARKVRAALAAAGYSTATAAKCRGYVINVAEYFEPGDVTARQEVLRIICEAAGIQPRG